MRDQRGGVGLFIGLGAAIGVLFMPIVGPLALVCGAAIGVVLGAAYASRTRTP